MKMMKGSTKPVSSPSRAQKFPPPLMRFLRSNAGSKSKGRSRSRSLFMRRKNTAAGVEISQEPSSPKVTCIGQVRVRRSTKSAGGGVKRSESRRKKSSPPSSSDQLPCCWARKTLFCHGFSKKLCKPRPLPSLLRQCGRFFGFGSCRRAHTAGSPAEESSGSEENGVKIEALVQEDNNNFLGSSSSPPKNALLLTRCRSAPYRSSSLACRFWGSPLKPPTQTDDSGIESKHLPQTLLLLIQEKPTSSPDCGNAEALESGRSQESEDFGSSNGEKCREESPQEPSNKVHPLLLTRCKSEPARTGERLVPDAGFWKLRRFAEPQLH
ncbi:PREDICTED: uncharacterized protein LOC109148725 [Ipomoea nil]|uniref:uncharacterized protein LOC109148725 n=1 Tax=Ipomoea nil TaxID=35883 RepID=UPI000900C549|nr:PREDICTED: uncharacterized protein LOC109148725 [Ipomoea nil]